MVTKFVKRLVFGGLAFIEFGFAQSQIHLKAQNEPYVARIIGPHQLKRFERKFLLREWKRSAGVVCFHGVVSGLYEIKYFAVTDGLKRWQQHLFVVVTPDGVVEVPLGVAKQVAELLTMMTWQQIEPVFAQVDMTNSDVDLEGSLVNMETLELSDEDGASDLSFN